MITKTFTQQYPDEPWKQDVTKNNTAEVTWRGMRYYTFSIVAATGHFFCVEDQGEDLDAMKEELKNMVHEGHTFHILDAKKHPQVAAYLIGDDTIPAKDATGGAPDYKFETPGDDEDWVYEYRTQNFVQSIYQGSDPLIYSVSDDTWTMPGFMQHPINKADLFDGYDAEAARIDAALADRADEFTDAMKTELEAQSTWLKTVRSNYASIDAWKIPHKEVSFTWD